MGLGQGCWQTTRGNQGHSANVLQAQEKTNHASCLASCPLHLYLQHHCAWITTPLINWTLGRKYTWTHTHRGTYCMHDRKLPRTSSSSEIIIMITKACYVFSTEVTSPRTRGGGGNVLPAWELPGITEAKNTCRDTVDAAWSNWLYRVTECEQHHIMSWTLCVCCSALWRVANHVECIYWRHGETPESWVWI